MNHSSEQIEVSFGSDLFDQRPEKRPIKSVLDTIASEANKSRVKEVRDADTPEKKKKAKARLPIACLHTRVEGGWKNENIKGFNPLIALDIDKVDKEIISKALKMLFNSIGRHSFYIGLSPSGSGIHVYLLIESPEDKKSAYIMLSMALFRRGMKLDLSFLKNDVQKLSITSNSQEFECVNPSPTPIKIRPEYYDPDWVHYWPKVLACIEDARSKGYDFVPSKRHDFIVSVAGSAIKRQIPIQALQSLLNKVISLSSFEDHAKTLLDAYKRYLSTATPNFKNLEPGKKRPTNQEIIDLIFTLASIRKNLLTNAFEIDGVRINDESLNTIFTKLWVRDIPLTKQALSFIIQNALTPSYHPVLEFLEARKHLQPNGEIRKLAKSIISSTYDRLGLDYSFVEEMLRIFLVAMIKQIFSDQPNEILIALIGKQNTGKTYFFRNLLPYELRNYFTESSFRNDKDFLMLMSSFILINDDELAGKRKVEMDAFKRSLSLKKMDFRVPYALVNETHLRIASFVGTGNDEAILRDPTGNRRIVPIKVDRIDHDEYNAVDKDLLFLEAYRLFEEGYSFKLSKSHLEVISQIQPEFEYQGYEEEIIKMHVRAADHLEDANSAEYLPVSAITNRLAEKCNLNLTVNFVGTALKKLQYPSAIKLVGNSKLRCYHVVFEELPLQHLNEDELLSLYSLI